MDEDEPMPSNDVGETLEKASAYGGYPLDIEGYASLYRGRTKVTRLLFIADRCGNEAMQMGALRLAYDEILKGEDSQLHREVSEKIAGRLGHNYLLDQDWADSVDRREEARKEKLESDLNGYMTSLIKEGIRMGYNDFGDFYYAHGQLGDAFKSYVRSRDYCTTPKNIIQMCLNVILVSIELGQFTHVSNYVIKAEEQTDPLEPINSAKLQCATGLVHLKNEKYKLAALEFLDTKTELGNNYTEVIAPKDVATYGGLCALATYDRTELKASTISYSFYTTSL